MANIIRSIQTPDNKLFYIENSGDNSYISVAAASISEDSSTHITVIGASKVSLFTTPYEGQTVIFKINGDISASSKGLQLKLGDGGSTITWGTAKEIVRADGSAIKGKIPAGTVFSLVYTGTSWKVLSGLDTWDKVDFLGQVDNNNTGTNQNATSLATYTSYASNGDYIVVSAAFGNYHIGDLLIYHKPTEATGTWVLVHGGYDYHQGSFSGSAATITTTGSYTPAGSVTKQTSTFLTTGSLTTGSAITGN